ncbi:hypothetical protein [Yoonia sp. SS1-5]|uniref:Aspartate carbamoyltransferase catalytic subunit n=1 Tax=Yoonia rhodophyticola TaxID=3137370 RepID=A0AAN0NM43_9RHOB
MTLTIPANDFGQIRVFEMRDQPSDAILSKSSDGLLQLFGTDALDPTYVDIIKIADLSSMQLTDYITQGYDMEPAPHDVQAVNGIEGYAILVMSSATRGQEVSLTLPASVRHVTTYVPEAQITVVEPLRSDAADGVIADPPAKPAKSDARVGGMVATLALIVLFLLVALMIWVA